MVIHSVDSVKHRRPHAAVLRKQFCKLLLLILIETVLRSHLIRRLVADSNIERRNRLLHFFLKNITIAVIRLHNDRLGPCFRPMGDLIHLPKQVLQKLFLFRSDRCYLLGIIRIRGRLDGIDRQHFRPHGTGTGHFKRIVFNGILDGIQLVLVIHVDFLNDLPHRLF